MSRSTTLLQRDGRLYRHDGTVVQTTRRRFCCHTEFDIRTKGDKVGFRGYASVYDQIAYREVVRAGAFDKTVAERDDVRALVNHQGVPIGRTKSGTLELELDDKGLIATVDDLDLTNPTVIELVSAMRRGDIDQMSFAFDLLRCSEYLDDETERWIFEILECRLWDVSIVTYPWYDETSVDLKGLDAALAALHDGRSLTDAQRDLVMARMAPSEARHEPSPAPAPTVPAVRSIDRLDALYGV